MGQGNNDICEVNSLDELMTQDSGAIVMGSFQNGFNDEDIFVVYNGTSREDRQAEFLEPGKRYYLNPDIDIHAWRFPADKLIFPGNGVVRLPVAYRKLKTYSPSDEGYSERRELVRRVE